MPNAHANRLIPNAPVRLKRLFEPASVSPVRSKRLFETAVGDHYSKVLGQTKKRNSNVKSHVGRMCYCCESRSVAHAMLWSCPGGHHVATYEERGAHLEEARGAHGDCHDQDP